MACKYTLKAYIKIPKYHIQQGPTATSVTHPENVVFLFKVELPSTCTSKIKNNEETLCHHRTLYAPGVCAGSIEKQSPFTLSSLNFAMNCRYDVCQFNR